MCFPVFSVILTILTTESYMLASKIKIIPGMVLTFLLSLVPVFKSCAPCPMCMPIYAGLCSLVGIKFADYSAYLMPVMIISMMLTLVLMHKQRQNLNLPLHPLLFAASSCISILTSKYWLNVDLLVYISMVGLFASTLWHQAILSQNRSRKEVGCKNCC